MWQIHTSTPPLSNNFPHIKKHSQISLMIYILTYIFQTTRLIHWLQVSMPFSKWRKLSDINWWARISCLWGSADSKKIKVDVHTTDTKHLWNITFPVKKFFRIKMRHFDFCKKKFVEIIILKNHDFKDVLLAVVYDILFIYLQLGIESLLSSFYLYSTWITSVFMNRWLKVAIREAIQWFTHCMPNFMTSLVRLHCKKMKKYYTYM